jgi:hypothetical protein
MRETEGKAHGSFHAQLAWSSLAESCNETVGEYFIYLSSVL